MNKRVKYALWVIMGVGVLYVNLGVAVHDEHIEAKQSMTGLPCVASSKSPSWGSYRRETTETLPVSKSRIT